MGNSKPDLGSAAIRIVHQLFKAQSIIILLAKDGADGSSRSVSHDFLLCDAFEDTKGSHQVTTSD